MALTAETLTANETLATLTPDQIKAIETLSINDETTTINTKIGEHHGLVEKDVKEISGIEKNQGEKSYDYMKRVMSEFKEKSSGYSTLQSQITQKEQLISDLEQKIANGKGNETLAQKLRDAESKLNALQSQYENEKTSWTQEKDSFSQKITGIQVDSEFGKVIPALKFKAEYPESVKSTLLNSAKSKILSTYKPDWVEADGQKTMVFRDKNGEILRNKANGLNPFSVQELLATELKDVLDAGRKAEGSGSKDPGASGSGEYSLTDLGSAKTQVEADAMIVKHLMSIGETRGSASFAEKQRKIRDENQVSKLPMK